jgi:hypothetical protein
MKRWAIMLAAATFFALALVGWASDVPPLVCGLRAAGGAAVMFVVARLALRMALSIVVEAVIRSNPSGLESRGDNRE